MQPVTIPRFVMLLLIHMFLLVIPYKFMTPESLLQYIAYGIFGISYCMSLWFFWRDNSSLSCLYYNAIIMEEASKQENSEEGDY